MSLRTDDDDSPTVGTQVGAMFASLATDIDDPVDRLLAIHDSTQGAKEMQQAMSADKIMGITEAAPPGAHRPRRAHVHGRGPRRAHAAADEPDHLERARSAVPALHAPAPRSTAMYPMGPLLYGTGINITVFSYLDNIDFGFMVRPRARCPTRGWSPRASRSRSTS